MRIILPSGGTATVSKNVRAKTLEALDELTQAARSAYEADKPNRRKRTTLSYKCRVGRHADCSAMRCKCDCGHGAKT